MCTLKQIFEQTELRSRQEVEEIATMILQTLYTTHQIPIEEDISNKQQILWFLINSTWTDCKKKLITLLEQYHVNKSSLLFSVIMLFMQKDLPTNIQQRFEHNFAALPYHNGFEKIEHSYRITLRNQSYQVTPLDWYPDTDISFLAIYNQFNRHCHQLVLECAPFLLDAYITVSTLPNLFGNGSIFHSYFTLPNEAGIIDFASNSFYEGTDFNQLYHPQEILTFPTLELEERIQALNQEVKDSRQLAPILRLALNEKKKSLKRLTQIDKD